jgi:nitric oxide dioxygenase
LFTDQEKEALRGSWSQVVPLADSWVDAFCRRVFELHPEYRTLFPLDMSGHKRRFVRLIAFSVKSLDFADENWREPVEPREDLLLVALALGRRHDESYRVPTGGYPVFGEALIYALEQVLQERLSAEARAAWQKAYERLALVLRLGGTTVDERNQRVSPEEVQRLGGQALLEQMAASSSLEARLSFATEPS